MKIRVARPEDQPAWDDYVLNHSEGLAYHQFAWKKAVENSYGLEGHYLVAEQDGSICGVLPLIYFKSLTRRYTLISLPYCDVGGSLAESKEIGNSLLSEAFLLCKKVGDAHLELRYAKMPTGFEPQGDLHKVRMTLDLPETPQALLSNFKPRLRNKIRKPIKNGLSVKLGGEGLLHHFYLVWSKNMKDLGSPVHSFKWFRAVLEGFGGRAKVGVVYTPDGEPAAAGIILLHANTVSNPWISSLKHLKALNVNIFLYWSFLSFATEKGYEKFDFGRSTPGGGTYDFKLRWGCKPEPIYWVEYEQEGKPVDDSLKSSSYRNMAERCWRCLPLGLCNSLGPAIRRYISL